MATDPRPIRALRSRCGWPARPGNADGRLRLAPLPPGLPGPTSSRGMADARDSIPIHLDGWRRIPGRSGRRTPGRRRDGALARVRSERRVASAAREVGEDGIWRRGDHREEGEGRRRHWGRRQRADVTVLYNDSRK
ncbi:hypothetical protein ACP70R_046499 [Stipagrostis hirtigluma subsp. patula]